MRKSLGNGSPGPPDGGRLPYAATVAAFLLLLLLALRPIGSLDSGFHLATGERLLAGEGWPRTDPFTYTVTDHEWIDTSWGYQVLAATAEQGLGATGVVAFHALLILSTFVIVLLTVRLVRSDPLVLSALVPLGVLAAEMRFEARPELVSYALLATVLYLVQRRAERGAAPMWCLPLIFLAWVNLHGLWIVGLGLTAVGLAGVAWRERRLDRKVAAWWGVAVLATLVNPYGVKAWTLSITLATRLSDRNLFGQSIGELVSPFGLGLSEQFPFFPWVAIWAFRVLALLTLLSLVPLVRQRRFQAVLLVPFAAYLSFTAVRNMPLLVVACLPGVIWATPLTVWLERLAPPAHRPRVRPLVSVVLLVATLLVGLRVVSGAYYVGTRRETRFGMGWNAERLPVHAVDYLDRTRLGGRMLNHLNFGGYLIWTRPDPVFIDGRLEVIGEAFYRRYRQALGSDGALEAAVRHWDIRWIIFPYKTNPRLLGRLSASPSWRLTYRDALATVFVRTERFSPHLVDASVDRGPAPVLELGRLPGLGGGGRKVGVAAWLQGFVAPTRFPTEPFSLGLFHYFRGELTAAAGYFARAIAASDGAYFEIYRNLGSALYRAGRLADAARCYRVVLEERPTDALSRERLDQIERRGSSTAP